MISRTQRIWLWGAAASAVAVAVILAENLAGNFLNQLLLYLPGIDKVLHVIQSALIFAAAFFLLRLVPVGRHLRLAIAVGTALCLALFDEWQQQWMAQRSVELADLMAGAAGVLFGVGVAQRSRWRILGPLVIAAGLVSAALVSYASYMRTKDFNMGLLAERRADMVSARRHFVDALNAGMHTASLYNELAWAEVESGVGDAAKAVEYAERSLAMRPGDADTLDTYGWALHRAGRSRDAIGPLTAALQKDPTIYCIHYHLGAVYLDLGDLLLARVHLQQQVKEQSQTNEAKRAAELLAGLSGS